MVRSPNTWWVILLAAVAAAAAASLVAGRPPAAVAKKCLIEGIFNFGDSNSDTGGFWAAFPTAPKPNGVTYFGKPAGRACDGRLIIDFIAEGLGLPFLSPYLKSVGSNYKHGVNFATLGSTVLLPQTSLFVSGVSPFSLSIQLNQMKEFNSIVLQHSRPIPNNSSGSRSLPSPLIFARSLYTFYIGQNDFTGKLPTIGVRGVQEYLPSIVSQITDTIKELYGLGGRMFWVLNLAPIGCYPAFLVELPHKITDLDAHGCMITYNKAVVSYNHMLKKELDNAQSDLPGASLIYVDIHSVLLDLFQHPTAYGMKYGTKACCGHGGGHYNFSPKVFCGNTKVTNDSTLRAKGCANPAKHVSWDGIHMTEAANKVVARAILDGSIFDPPFPLDKLCDLNNLS